MQTFPCACTCHIEQSTEFVPKFAGFKLFDESMQWIALQHGSRANGADNFFVGTMRGRDIAPAQDTAILPRRRAAETEQQDMIELQSFRPVHGHHLQSGMAVAGHMLAVERVFE
jgi:hypothetical protein